MKQGTGLAAVLRAAIDDSRGAALNEAVLQAMLGMADAAVTLSELIGRPPLDGRLGTGTGTANSDGDNQRKLDVVAEDIFSSALRKVSVASYLSEEVEAPVVLNPDGLLAIAIDPLDGSSNIDVNAPIGTIFSIFPAVSGAVADPMAAFRQKGRAQLAAGFFIYGPQTSLVLSLGHGTHLFTLDRGERRFTLVEAGLAIPLDMPEYAINASNYRHWHEPVQSYIDDCVQGTEGPLGRNFNMRWIASLVADTYRIFMRGGIFLYPADKRKGYERGRLRLMYEANPIAFLAEQAGGRATDGVEPILDRVPEAPHERVPFVMGSADKVDRVRLHHLDPLSLTREAPLFGRRGLLRV